jgi:endonuclease YncB( thermonuclease family)
MARHLSLIALGLALLLPDLRPAHAEDVLSNRLERRKFIEKGRDKRSRLDADPPEVTAKAAPTQIRAYDGGTLILGPVMYRLWGIAAPAMSEFGGYTAMQGLVKLIYDTQVACAPTGQTINGVAVARCKVDGKDLSAELVAGGYARDCPRQSAGTYADLERGAIVNVAGGFDLPAECLADW